MKLRTAFGVGCFLLIVFIGLLSHLAGIPLLAKTGTLPPANSLKTGDVLKHVKVTAYCPCKECCGEDAVGLTATGRDAWETDGVAVDFKSIPKNCVLEIPSVGEFQADDTGGAMRQDAKKGIYHIDLRFHDHETAKSWGVQWMDITVKSLAKSRKGKQGVQ